MITEKMNERQSSCYGFIKVSSVASPVVSSFIFYFLILL